MKLIYRIPQWLLYLLLHILVVLARYPLAPIAVIFFTTNDKRHLLFPFAWLETLDNDLTGDHGWKTEHIKPGSDPLSTWNRIGWLWRNGGNAVNYRLLGCRDDLMFRGKWWCSETDKRFWKRPDGYWLWRSFTPLFGRTLELFIGWGLFGPINGRCKFTCTIRLKKPKSSP